MATAPAREALHPPSREGAASPPRITGPMSPAAGPTHVSAYAAPPSIGAPPTGGALPPPSPFALARGHDDTALFQDGRSGFSHLLPGHPRFVPVDPRGPLADASVLLEDAPILVRYRLEPPRVSAPTAGEVAHLTAVMEAHARAGAGVATATVDHANTTWLSAWGVEGAAVAAYDVAPSAPGMPIEREDLFVLVRAGLVMTVRWTYPKELASDPAYAMFASVAEATMIWDAQRWQQQQRARVWPESRLLGPRMRPVLNPAWVERAHELHGLPLSPEERAAILDVLSTVVSNAGAPWVPIAPSERVAATSLLVSSARDVRLHAFVSRLADEVRCAHDLRGAALLVARAVLGPVRPSVPPIPLEEAPTVAITPPAPKTPSGLGRRRSSAPGLRLREGAQRGAPLRSVPPPVPAKSSVPPPLPKRRS